MSNVTYYKYEIAKGHTLDYFQAQVNVLLEEGYVPSGSMVIGPEYYYQPMILPSHV